MKCIPTTGEAPTICDRNQEQSYMRFEIGFWHPFGPHGRETPDEIIKRKQAEVLSNGWTLWSFQPRKTLIDWYRELCYAGAKSVFAFCSEGVGAVDPARDGTLSNPIDCQSYRFVGEEHAIWQRMPERIRVPHPFRPRQTLASAFVVQRVIYPVVPFRRPAIEWFSKGTWCQRRLPTRPEYLIRTGGTNAMPSVRAVLELKAPFLAVVNALSC